MRKVEPANIHKEVQWQSNENLVEATAALFFVTNDTVLSEPSRKMRSTFDLLRSCLPVWLEIEWKSPYLEQGFRYRRYVQEITASEKLREFHFPLRATLRYHETERWGAKERTITFAASAQSYTFYDVPSRFTMHFPPGTRVADRIMNTGYIISPHAEKAENRQP